MVPRPALPRFALALLALACAQPAFATDGDNQLWMSATASGPVHGKWLASLDMQQRAFNNMSRLINTQVRGAVGYRVLPWVDVYTGYLHAITRRPGNSDANEDRGFVQVGLTPIATGPIRLQVRSRLEARWMSTAPGMGLRFRQQVRVTHPLGASPISPYLGTTAEIFFHLKETAWGARRGLEQTRAAAFVGLPITRTMFVEVGYLNQYQHRAGTDGDNNALTLAFIGRF